MTAVVAVADPAFRCSSQQKGFNMHLKPVALAAALAPFAAALDVQVASSGGNKTSYHQYGFLHEDINNSGDGGIYAELIVNRAFQSSELYPVSLNGYHSLHGARLSIQNLSQPLSAALDSSMRVAAGNGSSRAGFENEGYWGMNVECQKYTGTSCLTILHLIARSAADSE